MQNMFLILFSLSFVVAQNPTDILNELCTNVREPLCEVYRSSCSSLNCQPWPIAYELCTSNGAAASNSACSTVKNYCSSNVDACRSQLYTNLVPTARNTSSLILSICIEMPSMKDCSSCPNPSPSTGISDCPVFQVYSNLCLDMPDMGQCQKWKTFCANNNKVSPFCSSKTNTTQASPRPLSKSSADAMYLSILGSFLCFSLFFL